VDVATFARAFVEAVAQHRHWTRQEDKVPA
jgi:hypothetical protein